MRIGIVRLAIIGIIVIGEIGAFLFRDRLTGNAAELKVGDCFDVPTTATEITDVQHHPVHRVAHRGGRLSREAAGRGRQLRRPMPRSRTGSRPTASRPGPRTRARSIDTEVTLELRPSTADVRGLGQGRPGHHLLRNTGSTARRPRSGRPLSRAGAEPGGSAGSGRGGLASCRRRPPESSAAIAPGVSCSWSSRPKRAA